ncbi:PilZ domain-containing protein [Jannaschia donghaensis]|uniref:PilZ domain-containing protein n=1 Tax=Jannaschia donghaensis TaxID=420998 RepID=A0A0M6YJL1_9RHOB|nr:PilZ domain-containing protein [Jannaschia donghaensis]CTQ50548.1 hypothetical protein JDO7802_02572 [Jannaschia donghaensis]
MQYRSRRIPSNADVTVVICGLQLTIPLIDVSETGMKLALAYEFPPDTAITIQSARLHLHGVVSWSTQFETGVRLLQPLGKADLGELAQIAWAA